MEMTTESTEEIKAAKLLRENCKKHNNCRVEKNGCPFQRKYSQPFRRLNGPPVSYFCELNYDRPCDWEIE